MAKYISHDQVVTMVEFMEKNGDISYLNNRHNRQQRLVLWQELKILLGKRGHGPDKSVEQWVKTWTDLKHRVKRKILYNRVQQVQTGGQARKKLPLNEIELRIGAVMGIRKKKPLAEIPEVPLAVPLEAHATSSSKVSASPSEVYVSPSTEVYVSPSSEVYVCPSSEADIAPKPEPVPSEDTQQSKLRRIMWLQQRIPTETESAERSHERVAKLFLESENRRLKSEEDRSWKGHDLEDRRLALEERRQALDERRQDLEERRLAFEERQEERAERQQDSEKSQLQLEILRENNLHEREAVRAQIDRDSIKIQQELFDLLKQALNKFLEK